MNNPLRTAEDYGFFLYVLVGQFPSVQRSTLTFIRRGQTLVRVVGALSFAEGFRIELRERILFDRLPGTIDWYSYEIWRGQEKITWYDPQPHPNDLSLQSTHPHHKHIPPDIKHNRIPAPEMSFTAPNLPALIAEVEAFIDSLPASSPSP